MEKYMKIKTYEEGLFISDVLVGGTWNTVTLADETNELYLLKGGNNSGWMEGVKIQTSAEGGFTEADVTLVNDTLVALNGQGYTDTTIECPRLSQEISGCIGF
tara:strand:- start:65 stop:373 length:309 start_codon:yes stop_codon:yes gene_type:complete